MIETPKDIESLILNLTNRETSLKSQLKIVEDLKCILCDAAFKANFDIISQAELRTVYLDTIVEYKKYLMRYTTYNPSETKGEKNDSK